MSEEKNSDNILVVKKKILTTIIKLTTVTTVNTVNIVATITSITTVT